MAKVYVSSDTVLTVKGKTAPLGTNLFFLLELTPLQKGFVVQKSKQQVTKVISRIKMAKTTEFNQGPRL